MTQKQSINVGELRSRGIVKLKGEGMFSLWVKTACCNLSSEQLRGLADIIEKYARGYLLFTTRQIPIIPFVKLEDLEKVQEELSRIYLYLDRCGPSVRNVNVCYEDKICPEAVTNSISLAEKLDNFFYVPMTHKVKIGVAGCQRDCISSRVLNDIGFVGVERDGSKGYDVYVGGRLGVNPFVGVKIADFLSEGESVGFVQNYFDFLKKEGKKEERGADLIGRLGLEAVKQELNKSLHQNSSLKPIECKTRLTEREADKIILRIRALCGEVSANQLRKIASIAERYGRGFVHFAVRGSPEIPCVEQKYLESIREELQQVGMQILDRGIDNLQSCFGNYCTENNADPQSLLRQVEKLVEQLGLNNLNIKISASGCPNSCGIAHLNDIGFIGVVEPRVDINHCNGCGICVPICKRKAIKIEGDVAIIDEEKCSHCALCIAACPYQGMVEQRRGFAVLVGGKEGKEARLGQVIAEFISEEAALQLAERCLRIVKERGSNVAAIIDEIGIEKFREILISGVSYQYCI